MDLVKYLPFWAANKKESAESSDDEAPSKAVRDLAKAAGWGNEHAKQKTKLSMLQWQA